MESVDVRSQLVEAIRLDLVGPGPGSDLEAEVLDQSPSRWYLTGFLVPLEAGESQRADETADDDLDLQDEAGGADDAQAPEPAAARRAFFPSSLGVSLLIAGPTRTLTVVARWGDYRLTTEADPVLQLRSAPARRARPAPETPPGDAPPPDDGEAARANLLWKRTPREASLEIPVPDETAHPIEHPIPGGEGMSLALTVRPVRSLGQPAELFPAGTRSVSVFLVNRRRPAPDDVRDVGFAFQAELEVRSPEPLVPRPNLRGLGARDWDDRVADLQYRDVCEFAVGHGVAARALLGDDCSCHAVRTCWVPDAEVEKVAPEPIRGVELGMEALAGLADGGQARERLGPLVTQYRAWIEEQGAGVPDLPPRRREIAEELLQRARGVATRIDRGIATLDDPQVLEAFKMANRAMAHAARRRFGTMQSLDPAAIPPPGWRPFQLAFLLMNLKGLVDPTDGEREYVDLLFFPTGGGKTEAYLGLAAFALVLRRLRNPGLASAGMCVLMRYTLRLLTLDQLGRAATLICALELERQKDVEALGDWPFEIGLWVGRAATPNRMGAKGDNDPNTARAKTIAFHNDDRKPSPIPLEQCPWCGETFRPNSFQLVPGTDRPRDLRVVCLNRRCDFKGSQPLPILAVDEPIYRRLPCFLIATVDKFAAMPWTGQVGGFFGRVDRHDKDGFYGPCDPGVGRPLPGPLHPPDLVIQDELHLISGPMGTMVGLYEAALDGLCTRQVRGKAVRPKIIASTATVRRAEDQIGALFNRKIVDVFPPPVPDRNHSFFARVHAPEESHPRLYLGVAAPGRSAKVMLLRVYLALLGAAQKAYQEAGGKKAVPNPADPYMTLLGYFNSLRELGGTRRLVEDEVNNRLRGYGDRKRVGRDGGSFARRDIAYEVVELTSRVSTSKVAEAKRRLSLTFDSDDRVDVAIATNMISVGLDITRLGLMVVFGQPKTCAEYIQATSRVGRDSDRPGLVVTLFNVHRSRDRSHFERFSTFHRSFYRSVEATSVTPFSPRALDRRLAGTLVALARLGHAGLTPAKGATEILRQRADLDAAVDQLAARAGSHRSLDAGDSEALRQRVRHLSADLLDEWSHIADEYAREGIDLQYQAEEGGARRLLYEFLDPELKNLHRRHRKFRANRSMRDVEPSVNLWVRTLDGFAVEEERG